MPYFREGPLPTLSKDEDDALDSVIYNVEMAAEEYIVEDLRRSIREVWEVALRIGVKHGQRQARQTHVNTTKELEQERVWGFDVGWTLATEKCVLKASKQCVPGPTLPSLCTVSTVATQTDPLPLCSPASNPTPASPSLPIPESRNAIPAADNDLDTEIWHEALELPPNDQRSPPSPLTFTRDFSDLRTGLAPPFASLRRRHRRATRTPSSTPPNPRRSRTPQTIVLKIYDTKPKTMRAKYPILPIPTSRPPPLASTYDKAPRLDWDRDPRLCDLSRALTALGWVRPG
ncbi:hypothetical protein DFH06DRAFT_1168122 [Mycena polygramma]|nr:hypothetical protein DFH06DRAFT_1168122 [Mycena polygramma]